MELLVERVSHIQVFPYHNSVALEVAPCFEAEAGDYARGGIEGMAYEALRCDAARGEGASALQEGATYSAIGYDQTGNAIQTHWMYCTKGDDGPRFGIARNHRYAGISGPAPFLDTSLFVTLAPLVDLYGIDADSPTDLGVSEFKLGSRGELIATAFGVPHAVGIRVENPALPPHMLKGARNLTIYAKSAHTGQTTGLRGLKCIWAQSSAYFLREDAPC